MTRFSLPCRGYYNGSAPAWPTAWGDPPTWIATGPMNRAQGDYGQALDYYQQSLAIRRQVGDRAGEGVTLWNIGATYTNQKLYDQALPHLQQAFIIFRAIGIPANQEGAANWIRRVLEVIGQQGNPAAYQGQCQATAEATGVAVTNWCEGL